MAWQPRCHCRFRCFTPCSCRGILRRRIPTQILELTWAAVILGAGILVWDHRPPPGAIFCLTAIAYGTGRFLLEPLRDRQRDSGLLRILSLVLVVGALASTAFVWFH